MICDRHQRRCRRISSISRKASRLAHALLLGARSFVLVPVAEIALPRAFYELVAVSRTLVVARVGPVFPLLSAYSL